MNRYIHTFESFTLNEAFDLNKYYTQYKVHPVLQEEALDIIKEEGLDTITVPYVEAKLNQIIFFVARTIKEKWMSIDWMSTPHSQITIEELNVITKDLKMETLSDAELKLVRVKKQGDLYNIVGSWIRKFCVTEEFKSQLRNIFDMIKSPAYNHLTFPVNWVSGKFPSIYQKSIEWHDSLKATGKIINETGDIIKKYPDGFYWIDLKTNSCRDEANAMGHCGNTRATTLWSLRDSNKEPHTTLAIYSKPEGNFIGQAKGKNNKKPISKYNKYLLDLCVDPAFNIQGFQLGEYNPSEDFNPFDLSTKDREVFLDKNPDLFWQGIGELPEWQSYGLRWLETTDPELFKYMVDNQQVEKAINNIMDWAYCYEKGYIKNVNESLINVWGKLRPTIENDYMVIEKFPVSTQLYDLFSDKDNIEDANSKMLMSLAFSFVPSLLKNEVIEIRDGVINNFVRDNFIKQTVVDEKSIWRKIILNINNDNWKILLRSFKKVDVEFKNTTKKMSDIFTHVETQEDCIKALESRKEYEPNQFLQIQNLLLTNLYSAYFEVLFTNMFTLVKKVLIEVINKYTGYKCENTSDNTTSLKVGIPIEWVLNFYTKLSQTQKNLNNKQLKDLTTPTKVFLANLNDTNKKYSFLDYFSPEDYTPTNEDFNKELSVYTNFYQRTMDQNN